MSSSVVILRVVKSALLLLLCATFETSAFAQCGGQISLSTDSLEWSGTQVGFQNQQSFEITNTGANDLCIFNVTSTSSVWLVSFNPAPIPPLGSTTVTLGFGPTLDRWYSGTIEIFSSDVTSPRDSVNVLARGCQTALAPGAPIIMPPTSPYMLYWAIPWDENKEGVEYAVQVRKQPENEVYYSTINGNLDFDPQWFTALEWVQYGIGAVGALEPGGNYEMTLLTRDCMENISVGVTVGMIMPQEIVEAPIEDFTVHSTVDGGPIELRWDPAVTDIFGTPLPFDGYYVLEGNRPDSIENLYAVCSSNFNMFPAESGLKLFTVYANTNGTYWGTSPFFTWPPDNAPLYGLNTVSLRDPANWSEWRTVRIQIDSMGFIVDLDIRTQDDLLQAEGITLAVDFDKYGVGPHTISAEVTDLQNVVSTVWKTVNVVERPRAEFIASYAPGPRLFDLIATNIFTPAPYIDLWWPTSTVDERYGSTIQFESKAGAESLHIVKPIPILASKILNEESPWPLPEDPTYGVVVDVNAPGNYQVIGNSNPRYPCCKQIRVEEHKVGHLPAIRTECVASPKRGEKASCHVVCNFKYVIVWDWTTLVSNTGWEVVTRSTRSDTLGTCAAGPYGGKSFVPNVKGDVAVNSINYKEKKSIPTDPGFPFAAGVNATHKSSGTSKPQKPAGLGKKGVEPIVNTTILVGAPAVEQSGEFGGFQDKKTGVRVVGNFYFKVTAYDACAGVCEEERFIQYDVFCCPSPTGCTHHEVLAPAIRTGELPNP